MTFTETKSYGIIIQFKEDDPQSPGWWRYGRPHYIEVAEPPPLNEMTRWVYGSVNTAEGAQRAWDLAYDSPKT